ncbi:LCP family protein [Streptomyces sp. NRRL F-5126]|uniref:LCP family protein n=1 Tax=Streptomyces sp. NRRL F-5126 TaxID=1463857 RepID=UPI0004C9C098|nr:LCP family protein [Streptomyces sp. NRRL F-5126]
MSESAGATAGGGSDGEAAAGSSDIDAIPAIPVPGAADAAPGSNTAKSGPAADNASDAQAPAGTAPARGADEPAPATESAASATADPEQGPAEASGPDEAHGTEATTEAAAPGAGATGADAAVGSGRGGLFRGRAARPARPGREGRGGEHTGAPGKPPHGRRRPWLRWIAGGVGVVVLAAAGTGWWFYQKLNGNITSDTHAAAELQTYEKERPTPVALDALNVLLIGSDTRTGKGNGKYGRDDGARSDTTILLHLAADRKSATAVSIPRDLMVHIPSCGRSDGTTTKAQFAQFNWAYSFGGTACTTRTVEKLTGVRIDHEMVIDFHGFKDMVNAIGGVQICLDQPVDDQEAHLHLPAGRQTVHGEQALGFVRARHGIGDGSDTQRIQRQQGFLGALFKKVQSNGVLLNPARLYPLLDAATKSITTDPGLASLRDLYNLVHSMRDVPTDKVQFVTVPVRPYSLDHNRDEIVPGEAKRLFQQIRDDAPVTVKPSPAPGTGGASGSASGSPADTAGKDSGKSTGRHTSTTGPSASATGRISGAPTASPGASQVSPGPTFTGTNASVGLCA